MEDIVKVKIIEDSNKIDWESWTLLVAVLALIASVIIPFAQKKYEEYRTKRNFQFYLKKQIGLVLNLLTTVKLEYIQPSVRNDPKKELLLIKEYIQKLKSDFVEHKNSNQPRVIFTLLMNIQKFCQFSYNLRLTISTINSQTITEKTLEHGKELSKRELSNIYGLILIYESYISISQYHDKFSNIKSIQRLMTDKAWIGLSVENDLIKNQEILNQDLLFINDNENSLEELQNIVLILNQETKKYFNYDKLQEKRNQST